MSPHSIKELSGFFFCPFVKTKFGFKREKKEVYRGVSFRSKGTNGVKKGIEQARWESAQGGWRMPPHLLALVVVLGLVLGDAAGSLANGAQAHIQFR